MCKKGYKQTKEHRAKLKLVGFQKGHGRLYSNDPASEKERGKRISQGKMGKKNWKIAGANHYLWNGKTPLVNQIRKCTEYYKWRDFVFMRDKYTCQDCGESGVYLHADHIKQFAFIVNENKLKTLEEALKCSDLWDTNNGRTLCVNCHRKIPVFSYNGKRRIVFNQEYIY